MSSLVAPAGGGAWGGVRGRLPRRRWLLGAAALPAALTLPACGNGIPFSGTPEPGSCLSPSEDIPEDERETLPDGARGRRAQPSRDNWFLTSGFAVSPDGTMLAACEYPDRYQLGLAESYGVIIWDTGTGEVVRRFSSTARGAIAWRPEGTSLAIADARHLAIMTPEGELLWHLIGHELPRRGLARIREVAFSPDGSQVASLSTDETVRLWAPGDDT